MHTDGSTDDFQEPGLCILLTKDLQVEGTIYIDACEPPSIHIGWLLGVYRPIHMHLCNPPDVNP